MALLLFWNFLIFFFLNGGGGFFFKMLITVEPYLEIMKPPDNNQGYLTSRFFWVLITIILSLLNV